MTRPDESPTPSYWQREYAAYLAGHRHPANRATHYVGIPLLIVSLIVGLALLSWRIVLGGQLLGWTLQLLGHRIEGNKPVLLKRPMAFLTGPAMVLVALLEALGFRFAFVDRARLAAESGTSPENA